MSPAPERCLTCSDEAVEAEVGAVNGPTAVVRVGGGEGSVAIDLVPHAAPGDRLLCHAGIALDIVPQAGDHPMWLRATKSVPRSRHGAGLPADSADIGVRPRR